jgi:hypothetical protein
LAPLPLSVEKPWDPPKPAAATAAAAPKAAAGAGAVRGKGRGGKGRSAVAAGAAKKRERSRRERFMDVELFWRSCSPEQRSQLLQVPLAPLLEGEWDLLLRVGVCGDVLCCLCLFLHLSAGARELCVTSGCMQCDGAVENAAVLQSLLSM